ncbi:MAG: anti-sigma factor [Actinomycetota bacterium]
MSTTDDHLDDELDPDDLAALEDLLGHEAVWAEPPDGLEDAIVAAISAEAQVAAAAPTIAPPPPPPPAPSSGGAEVIPFRRRLVPLVGAAAAVVLAVFGLSVAFGTDDEDGVLVALAATDLAPGASGEADVIDTPNGVKILLDVTGLPPAAEGTYYQAWVRNADGGVSAGTFHLRGGGGEIELWSGVPIEDYPIITVTLQTEGEGPASSGMVVLRGELSAD